MTAAGAFAKPIHIPMYTPTAKGGHARYTHELVAAMAEQGATREIQVSVVTSVDLDASFRTPDYPIHDFLPPLRDRESFRTKPEWLLDRLRFYARRNKMFIDWAVAKHVHAVHFQEFIPWTAPIDIRRLRRRGVRTFATVHNVEWVERPPLMPKWLPRIGNRHAWLACDGLFVHSELAKRELSAFLGGDHPPIWVMPHGVWSTARAAGAPVDPATRLARRQLLFFGTVTPYKGIDVLIRALEHLPEYSLVVAGAPEDSEYAAQVQSLADGFPPGRVRIEGRFLAEEEIGPLFDASSVVALPYRQFASQSGVLHDAVAHGVPVVASDFGVIGESVRAWGVGEVVEPGDPVALARGIRAVTEPENYARATEAAERVREERSWGASARVVLDAYEQVLRVPA